MGFEDEVEQSLGRPCRQSDGRSKRTYELTSSIVPRGTSFHRWVEFEFPPIAFDPARLSSRCDLPGPAELGAINPYAVHDHCQPTRQGYNRLFQPAVPGNLHRPGLEPGPSCRTACSGPLRRASSASCRLHTAISRRFGCSRPIDTWTVSVQTPPLPPWNF